MLLTIFTPTFNRAHTLDRAFESLCRQSNRDFEWVVVNDGSRDNTDSLIADFKTKADFPIRYFKKENGGKHTAYNLALDIAEGSLFFVLDSDDTIPDTFMETVTELYADIDGDDSIGGAVALISDNAGKLRGIKFADNLRATPMALEKRGYNGEYVFIFKTIIAKQFKFPVIESEKYMPLRIVYDMFEEYQFITVNKVLTFREYLNDGLSYSYKKYLVDCPIGFMMFHKNRYLSAKSLSEKIHSAIAYSAFRHLAQEKGYAPKGFNPLIVRLMSLPGAILAHRFKKNAHQPPSDISEITE